MEGKLKFKAFLIIGLTILQSCQTAQQKEKKALDILTPKEEFFVVPGEDEPLDPIMIKKGKVLISYSDCYECHKIDQDATGPAFLDISKRYPSNQTYIEFLARKIIDGGSGTWGSPVMAAHPDLSQEDAETMIVFILSIEEK